MPNRVGRNAPFGQVGIDCGGSRHRNIQVLRDIRSRHRLTVAVRDKSLIGPERLTPHPVSPFGLMAPGIFAVMAPLWGSEMAGSNGFKNA